jgi:hypothetical protein
VIEFFWLPILLQPNLFLFANYKGGSLGVKLFFCVNPNKHINMDVNVTPNTKWLRHVSFDNLDKYLAKNKQNIG